LIKKNAPNFGAFGVPSEYEPVVVHLITTNAPCAKDWYE